MPPDIDDPTGRAGRGKNRTAALLSRVLLYGLGGIAAIVLLRLYFYSRYIERWSSDQPQITHSTSDRETAADKLRRKGFTKFIVQSSAASPEDFCCGSVGGRLALTWRDNDTQARYFHLFNDAEPWGYVDESEIPYGDPEQKEQRYPFAQVSRIPLSGSSLVRAVFEINGLPALGCMDRCLEAVEQPNRIVLALATCAVPRSEADWRLLTVHPGVAGLREWHAAQVGGRPFFAWVDPSLKRVVCSWLGADDVLAAEPRWHSCELPCLTEQPEGGHEIVQLEILDIGGCPLVLYEDREGIICARASSPTPFDTEDWQATLAVPGYGFAVWDAAAVGGKPVICIPGGKGFSCHSASSTSPRGPEDWRSSFGSSRSDESDLSLADIGGQPAVAISFFGYSLESDVSLARVVAATPRQTERWSTEELESAQTWVLELLASDGSEESCAPELFVLDGLPLIVYRGPAGIMLLRGDGLRQPPVPATE